MSALAAADNALQSEFNSLLVIALIAAATPLIVGLLRLKIAEVVLFLAAGVVFGPHVLGLIAVDPAINLLSQLGLGFLFFVAGLELDQQAVRGRSGKLAMIGWAVSALLAAGLALALESAGLIHDALGVAIALTSTALGTLLPILRDSGDLNTPLGTYFMGAGALGEFGPILAISLLLSSQNPLLGLLALAMFAAVVIVFARVPAWLKRDRITQLLARQEHTSAQSTVRLTVLLLVALLAISADFGLDVILGAFVAGVIVRRYLPSGVETRLEVKIEGLAFGIFVPIFFIISGANLDIMSIIEAPLPMLIFFVMILVVRGVPQYFIYRRAIPNPRERTRFMLLVSTGLPIIVAVTSLEVADGVMQPSVAAAMVGAGALSVLVFPLVATVLKRSTSQAPRTEATA